MLHQQVNYRYVPVEAGNMQCGHSLPVDDVDELPYKQHLLLLRRQDLCIWVVDLLLLL
jgi:hypothetical protein